MKNIRVVTAKKRTGNEDAKVGLLAGHESDEGHEVHTDGNGAVIEMEEVGSPTQVPKSPVKSPAVTAATTPSKTPAAVKKGSEVVTSEMEEVVVIDQFAIPEAVKAKMGALAPRYVCMGEGDASGHQFVQFLYATENEAKQAATLLNQKLGINKKGQDNRVFACSLKPKVFPLFAQMRLFRVTVFPATYFKVFGKDANPTMSRMNLENSLAVANGQQAPHRITGASRAAQHQGARSGTSSSNVPLTKSTMPDDVEEENLYDLLTLAEDKGSSESEPNSDSEHRSNDDVRVLMTPSASAKALSERKDKEEISAARAGDGVDAKRQETEQLLATPASDKKKGRNAAVTSPVVNTEDAADQQECVIF